MNALQAPCSSCSYPTACTDGARVLCSYCGGRRAVYADAADPALPATVGRPFVRVDGGQAIIDAARAAIGASCWGQLVMFDDVDAK